MEKKMTSRGIGSRAAACLERFREAMAWRREVEQGLAGLELTLAQWIVLDATRSLVESTKDAVSQADVAKHTEMDRMTISQVMRNLDRSGLVDRGPSLDARAWRIILTARGERAVRQGAAQIEAASTTWLGKRRPRGR